MSIRKRLIISFALIIMLFGFNLCIYLWGNSKESDALNQLLLAQKRQELITKIKQNLTDLHKQNTLLVQLITSNEVSEISEHEFELFNSRSDEIAAMIEAVSASLLPAADSAKNNLLTNAFTNTESDASQSEQSMSSSTAAVAKNPNQAIFEFEKSFQALSASWRKFYVYFGRDHTKALVELAIHTEPLSAKIINVLLPKLVDTEKQNLILSQRKYHEVSELVLHLTVAIFLVSMIFSMLIAILLSKKLTDGLARLQQGVDYISAGHLDQKIEIISQDELASLSIKFNEMAENLKTARDLQQHYQHDIEQKHAEADHQRQRSEELLRNILPASIARELDEKGEVTPQYFEDATVLFADIKGFTLSSEKLAADQLVEKLHRYFTAFDEIIDRHGIEKLKTIGDCYMCVCGLPKRNPSHPVDMVLAALEMIGVVNSFPDDGTHVQWDLRIGIHTGPVISGVVGFKKFAFDIWGETVNFAARIESAGEPGKINISQRTYNRVKDFFSCQPRGEILTKEKRRFPMYFVDGLLPELSLGDENPPKPLEQRFQVYFQKKPLALSKFLKPMH